MVEVPLEAPRHACTSRRRRYPFWMTPGDPRGVTGHGWRHTHAPPQTPTSHDGRAAIALTLGLASMCLGFLAGIPAIVLGSTVRRDIERARGGAAGSALAAAGVVFGLFGTGASLVAVVAALGGALGAFTSPDVHDVHDVQHAQDVRAARDGSRVPGPASVPIAAAGTRSYGALDVVDLDDQRPLRVQLLEVTRVASGRGRIVMLQTYVRRSRECAQIADSLADPKMQRALANVTLIRADIDTFEDELAAMHVPTDAAPWFYVLDGKARPSDGISADEWDDNVPENMAPILADFTAGEPIVRRAPAPVGTAL